MLGFPIINEFAQSSIQVILLIFLIFLNLKIYKCDFILQQNPNKIRIYFIILCICICIIDLIFSAYKKIFPMIFFIIRSFLIIFLSKQLRVQWLKIFKIICLTKNMISILLLNFLFFGLIGHILFIFDEFSTLFSSLDNMLVMLTARNFPDIMFKTFPQSKFSIFYFVPFLLINFILIISLIKALYYSNYFEINKEEVLSFLNELTEYKLYPNKKTRKHKKGIIIEKNNETRTTETPHTSTHEENNNSNLNIKSERNDNKNSDNENKKIDINFKFNFDESLLTCNSNEVLLENFEKITDRERLELYNYLKIIYSNFSLTKNEVNTIKKIIYFYSENRASKSKLSKIHKEKIDDKKVAPQIFVKTSNFNNPSSLKTFFINDNLHTLHDELNYTKQKVLNEEEKFLFNLTENNKLETQVNPIKRIKELNKFLLLENQSFFNSNKFLKFTQRKSSEIVLNFINIAFILILYFDLNCKFLFIVTIVHITISLYFIFEYIQFLKYYNFLRMIKIHLLRSINVLINIFALLTNLALLIIVILYSLDFLNKDYLKSEFFTTLEMITKSFVVLRAFRIFILLNKFKEFYTIFTTIYNLKGIFSSILWTLISFCFIFITISMILFGGKIDKFRFKENVFIPQNYYNLNFNDYASGFIFCFAMIMINNMNIIFDDFSLIYGKYMKLYFLFFFFLATILIVNISQMLVLEMYLNIKDTFSKLNRDHIFSRKSGIDKKSIYSKTII